MSSSELTIPKSIDREVRRVHPDGKYEHLLVDRLDANLPSSRLRSLLTRLNSSPGVVAELEPVIQDADRSHTIHIGQRNRPSWLDFNRTLPDSTRADELRENGPIVFLNVQLSRVGPFSTSYWNNFVLENEKPTPTILSDPPSFEWAAIQNLTQETLESYGIERVSSELLNKPISWLSSSLDRALENRGRFPGPTVYHALFGELY